MILKGCLIKMAFFVFLLAPKPLPHSLMFCPPTPQKGGSSSFFYSYMFMFEYYPPFRGARNNKYLGGRWAWNSEYLRGRGTKRFGVSTLIQSDLINQICFLSLSLFNQFICLNIRFLNNLSSLFISIFSYAIGSFLCSHLLN